METLAPPAAPTILEEPLAVEAASLPLARGRMTRAEVAGFLVYRLSCGDVLTAGFASALTGMDAKEIGRLLGEVSRVTPLYADNGYWRMLRT